MMRKMKSLMRLIGIALALLLLFTAGACNTAQEKEIDTQEAETSDFIVDEETVLCWLDENDNFVISYSNGTTESYSLNNLEYIKWGILEDSFQSVFPKVPKAEEKRFFETFFKKTVILTKSCEQQCGVFLDINFTNEQNWHFYLDPNGEFLIFIDQNGNQYVSPKERFTFDQLKVFF